MTSQEGNLREPCINAKLNLLNTFQTQLRNSLQCLQKPHTAVTGALPWPRLVQEAVDQGVKQPARRVEPGRHAARVAQEEARAPQACRHQRSSPPML